MHPLPSDRFEIVSKTSTSPRLLYETVEFIRYPTGASVEVEFILGYGGRGDGVLRGPTGEKTEKGYRGRSKILIHNLPSPIGCRCRAIYDPVSDLNYALVSSDPPLKSSAGKARESTRAHESRESTTTSRCGSRRRIVHDSRADHRP